MTNEQDRPSDDDGANEPTEVLGSPTPPNDDPLTGDLPADDAPTDDTARLWSEPQTGYQQPIPDPAPSYVPEQPDYGYPSYPAQQPQQPPQLQQPAPSYQYAGQQYPYYPQYAAPQQTQPVERGPRASVPGWLWPLVAAVALVVGTIGGVIGATIVSDDTTSSDGGFFEDTNDDGQIGDDETVAPPLSEDNRSVAAVAAKLLPSTVQVNANGGAGTAGQGATGSGFVADAKGHVITNNHVVAGATGTDELEVVDFDGKVHKARIIGRSPVYDIAVLSVSNFKALKPAALGSSRAMSIGETVVAIGSPLGLSSTVTSGIISAIDRPVTTSGEGGDSSYINAVQTDAAINPGNSGGPLVNLRGEVVGVNSAIATTGGVADGEAGNIGVGFAIPMEQVKITANQILRTGEARYPVIGATVNTVAEKKGANIVGVNDGTPAQKAGLKKDDLVVAVDGKQVDDSIGLIVAIRAHQPGETITLTYVRGGVSKQLDITLDSEADKP